MSLENRIESTAHGVLTSKSYVWPSEVLASLEAADAGSLARHSTVRFRLSCSQASPTAHPGFAV